MSLVSMSGEYSLGEYESGELGNQYMLGQDNQ